jgi:3-hydroxyisobutyrate dehydrogenase
VSGNGLVVKAGKLSAVVSGPGQRSTLPALHAVLPPRGVSYVGDGEYPICKIAHNVMLGVVIQNSPRSRCWRKRRACHATPSSNSSTMA